MSRRISFAAMSAAVLAGSLSGAPSQAADYYNATVESVVTNKIIVQSNGSSYHRMAPLSSLIANVHVELDTGTSGRIKWFTAWLGLGREGLAPQYWPDYREDGYHKSFDPRPKSWSGTVPVAVPESSLELFALGQCNYQAQTLRDQGLSNKAIFAKDRPIELAVIPHLDHEMTGPSGTPIIEGTQSHKKVQLVCQKWPGVAAPVVGDALDSVPPVVEKASLTVLEHATLIAGRCRISLSGVVETAAPNADFSFRYKDGAGHQSEVFELSSDHTRTAMFSHDYDIPVNADSGESGKVRIVGVSGDFASSWAHYDMDCTAPSFEALLPPKLTMQVIPRKPTMYAGQYCPSEVKIVGKIEGRAEMSGEAIFFGDYYLSPPQAYEVQKGDVVLLGADRDLDWSEADLVQVGQVRKLTIQLGFNVTGPSDTIVAKVSKKDYTFSCMIPSTDVQAGQGVMSGPPRPEPAPAAPRLRLAPQAVPESATPTAPRQPALRLAPKQSEVPQLRLQRQRLRQRN